MQDPEPTFFGKIGNFITEHPMEIFLGVATAVTVYLLYRYWPPSSIFYSVFASESGSPTKEDVENLSTPTPTTPPTTTTPPPTTPLSTPPLSTPPPPPTTPAITPTTPTSPTDPLMRRETGSGGRYTRGDSCVLANSEAPITKGDGRDFSASHAEGIIPKGKVSDLIGAFNDGANS